MPMFLRNSGKMVLACCLALAGISCGSNRLYKGYGYTGSANALDMGGQVYPAPLTQVEQTVTAETHQATAPIASTQQDLDTKTGEINDLIGQAADQPAPVREMAGAALDDAARLAAEGKPISHQALAQEMTGRMVSEGKMPPLSEKQQQTLDRLTKKMDKKLRQQGREIDWKNNTGLELFFMIMAIGGLVLGIIGIAFGWFVFIVFAGLWLYWKLVKD
jgi:hypothetical protein